MITFSSGYVATEFKQADLRLSSPFTLTEYQNLLINLTPLPAVLHRIWLAVRGAPVGGELCV